MRVILFVIIFLAGCSLLNMTQYQKPVIKLNNIEMEKVSLDKIDLIFTVLVNNPNDFGISMKSLKYEIEMNDNKIATQDITDLTEIKAGSQSIVRLPLSLSYADIFGSIGALLKTKESTYTIHGSAQFGFITLPFSESGNFKIENGELTHSKK